MKPAEALKLIIGCGTSLDGRLLPFKRGGFLMAQQLELPILPITISGSNEILPKGCLFPRPGALRLRFHPPLAPADYPQIQELIAATRAAIASGLDSAAR